jgi:colicin import membrane protein
MFGTLENRDFYRHFFISLGVHVLLILIAYLGGSVIVDVFHLNQNVEIIRASVRVDVVGMPKFTVQELKTIQAEAVPKAEPEPKGEEVEKKAKIDSPDLIKKDDLVIQEKGEKKKSSFMSLISDYSSKKVSPRDQKKGQKTSTNTNLDSLIIEGNRLSKGSALVGDYSDEQNSEFSAYVQGLPELVRNQWKLPSYLKDQNLKCRIAVYLASSGEVVKTDIIESSGQEEFDARAERAIREAAPFPKPSSQVASRLSSSGVILRFPL